MKIKCVILNPNQGEKGCLIYGTELWLNWGLGEYLRGWNRSFKLGWQVYTINVFNQNKEIFRRDN